MDMTRGYYLMSKSDGKKMSSISTILLDRIIGLHSLLMVGFLSLSLQYFISDDFSRLALISWTMLGASMFLIFSLAVPMVSQRTGKLVRKFIPERFRESYEGLVLLYRNNRKSFIPVYGISLINAILNVLTFTIAGRALGYSMPIWIASVSVPLMALSSLIPLTPGGLGIGEAATAEYLTGFDISGGGAVSLLMRMMFYVWALVGGVLFLFESKTERQKLKSIKKDIIQIEEE